MGHLYHVLVPKVQGPSWKKKEKKAKKLEVRENQ